MCVYIYIICEFVHHALGADAGPQRWRGTIHVAYDSPAMLEAAAQRLRTLQAEAGRLKVIDSSKGTQLPYSLMFGALSLSVRSLVVLVVTLLSPRAW